ncbi:hypothetical protein CALCODRAFT_531143 [Calocera cornea HHB12733]|uniref:DUF6532 domain-containing protein n=1 Tax=Calocera cornea HHB12733 TaxID=1353952 RepID=A0A165DB52_9BASI|nr:hypothetical protein CALCODRAFT_531143 [Calocera cornea HHB12733]
MTTSMGRGVHQWRIVVGALARTEGYSGTNGSRGKNQWQAVQWLRIPAHKTEGTREPSLFRPTTTIPIPVDMTGGTEKSEDQLQAATIAATATQTNPPTQSNTNDANLTAQSTNKDDQSTKATQKGPVVKDQDRMTRLFSAFKQTDQKAHKGTKDTTDDGESDGLSKAVKRQGPLTSDVGYDSDDADSPEPVKGLRTKKRILSESDEEIEVTTKKRRTETTKRQPAHGEGLRPAGLAMLEDGSYVMVYDRTLPAVPIPPIVKSEPVEIEILSSGGEEADVFSIPKKTAPAATPRPKASSSSTSKTTAPGTRQTVSTTKDALPVVTATSTALGGRHTKKDRSEPDVSRLEQSILRLAIPFWKLHQGTLQLFPPHSEAVEWAETAMNAAVEQLVKRGGTDAAKNIKRLQEKREQEILKEIRSHSDELLANIIDAAKAKVPVYMQHLFEGKATTVAWRVRRLLHDLNFIYDGYDWEDDQRKIPKAAFLSPIMVAVMGVIWKRPMQLCGETEGAMFDKMPLHMIAVTCLGIWIYLKSWWTGVPTDVSEVLDEIDIPKVYERIVDHILKYENDTPDACEAMQRELTRRVR